MIKIYKNTGAGGNGEFVIATDAKDADDFKSDLGHAILMALEACEGDDIFTIDNILENAFPLYLKLCGYKADTVHEEKVLVSGYSSPKECKLIFSNERVKTKEEI